jgi:hypothetical protein
MLNDDKMMERGRDAKCCLVPGGYCNLEGRVQSLLNFSSKFLCNKGVNALMQSFTSPSISEIFVSCFITCFYFSVDLCK